MKKITIIFILAIIIFSAKAQKLEKPVIDKITGDTSISTSKERIYSKGLLTPDILYCQVSKFLNGYILEFNITNSLDVSFTVSPEKSIILKTINGELLTFKPLKTYYSETTHAYSNGYHITITQCRIPIVLLGNEINKLRESKIAIIRIESSEGSFDYEIKEKNSDLIKREFGLFAK